MLPSHQIAAMADEFQKIAAVMSVPRPKVGLVGHALVQKLIKQIRMQGTKKGLARPIVPLLAKKAMAVNRRHILDLDVVGGFKKHLQRMANEMLPGSTIDDAHPIATRVMGRLEDVNADLNHPANRKELLEITKHHGGLAWFRGVVTPPATVKGSKQGVFHVPLEVGGDLPLWSKGDQVNIPTILPNTKVPKGIRLTSTQLAGFSERRSAAEALKNTQSFGASAEDIADYASGGLRTFMDKSGR